ncbi:MAG TPA: response regulator [Terriglobales bacterium]|nr:response regulator [Terriglobales bacterium]
MKRKIQEKILVVDDELRMCESLKTLLSNSGYEVEAVQDGEEAIQLINENNFDLILADIKMPKVSGVDILRTAKSKDTDNLVILMTGYGSLDTAIQAIEEGAYDYFLKPIEFDELERAIKRGLEKRKADTERKRLLEELKDANQELEKRVDELNALYLAGRALSSTDTLEDLLANILSLATKVIGAKIGSILLLDTDSKTLSIKSAIGLDKQIIAETRLELGKGVSGYVAEKGQPLLVENIEKDPRFKRISKEKYETKSLVCTPLEAKGKILGVINLNNKVSGEVFNSEDLKLITTFASQAAIAIDDAYNFEQSRKKIAQLSVLHQIASRFSTLDDFEELSGFIFEELKKIMPLDFSFWFDWDEKTQKARLSLAQGIEKSSKEKALGLEILIPDLDIFDRDRLCGKLKSRLSEVAVIPRESFFCSFPILAEGAFHGIICAGNFKQVPLTKEEEEIIHIVGSQAASIYERQRAILSATRLLTMGNMMSEITHDLKKPLTNLKGVIQLLKEGKREGKKEELLDILNREIQRASELVRELVDFSNPSKYQTEKKSILLPLEKSLKLLRTDIEKNKIKLIKSFPDNLPQIYINENEILEVFINVLLNAIESMAAGGELKVELGRHYDPQKQDSFLEICITDQGVGIAKENLNRIFERYFTTKEGGSGLGLSIVERIVKAHNGFFKVESRLNKGTKFVIYLPCSW